MIVNRLQALLFLGYNKKAIIKDIQIIMDDKAFSSIDWVGQCLVDRKRTVAFREAIKKIVKPDHIVFDVGTGSGIMALIAADCGARQVYAIEYDPYIAEIAKRNIIRNNFENKIKLMVGDARNLNFKGIPKPGLVIAEMLTTGMIDEFQVQAINNLHKKRIVTSRTKFIPCKQETCISLAYANFNMYGLKMNMVVHLWEASKTAPVPIAMTDFETLSCIHFNKINDENLEKIITFKPIRNGKTNCVYLKSRTFLGSNFILSNTESVNALVIIPIKEIQVKRDQKLKFKISYKFGGGFENFSVNPIV